MDKMQSPRGLIRYATQNAIANHWTRGEMWRRIARPRVLIYSLVLVAIASAFIASLALRAPFKADVVRDRGALARLVDGGAVENVYRVQLMNATESRQRFHIDVEGLEGAHLSSWSDVVLGPTEARWVPLAVQLPREAARAIGSGAHAIKFHIASSADVHSGVGDDSGQAERREKSTFVVPR
jgi:polyferredoxin